MKDQLKTQLAHNKYHRLLSANHSTAEIAEMCGVSEEEVREASAPRRGLIVKKPGRKPRQLNIDDTLTCKSCGYPKTIAGFSKDDSKPLGLSYTCKWCRSQATKQTPQPLNRPQELYYQRIVGERGTQQARLDLEALKQRVVVFEAAIQTQEKQERTY